VLGLLSARHKPSSYNRILMQSFSFERGTCHPQRKGPTKANVKAQPALKLTIVIPLSLFSSTKHLRWMNPCGFSPCARTDFEKRARALKTLRESRTLVHAVNPDKRDI